MRELIAEIVHEQWASWMKYQLSRAVEIGGARTCVLITDARKWMRQANTPYEDRSEAEKESDREWADKYLAVLNANDVGRLTELEGRSFPYEDDMVCYQVGLSHAERDSSCVSLQRTAKICHSLTLRHPPRMLPSRQR